MIKGEMERNSNIEILRILSMMFIVWSHFMGQSGAFDNTGGYLLWAYLLGSASKIGVALFVFIGAWFLVDKEFSAKRILNLWGETIFYTVTVTVAVQLIWGGVGIKNFISSFFPFLRRPLWFVSAYISLLLISPYINILLNKSRKIRINMFFTMFLIGPVVSTTSILQDSWFYNVFGFIFLYIFIGVYKKDFANLEKNKKIEWILPIISIILYLSLVIFKYIGSVYSDHSVEFLFLHKISSQLLQDFLSVPNLIISFGIFSYFKNKKYYTNKYVNTIAKSALSVYIIHQVPCFYPILWNNILKCYLWQRTSWFIPGSIGIAIVIYVTASLIDAIRRRYIEKIWINSKIYSRINVLARQYFA